MDKEYRGITFSEVRRNIELFALGLASLGMKRGDRISIVSENRPEWVVADMAMVCLGIVNVPIYPTLTPKQIDIFNDAGVRVAIASNAYQVGKIQKIRDNVKTLSHVVLMSEKGGPPPENVLTFSEIMDRGKDHEHKVGNAFFSTEMSKVKPQDLLKLARHADSVTGRLLATPPKHPLKPGARCRRERPR